VFAELTLEVNLLSRLDRSKGRKKFLG